MDENIFVKVRHRMDLGFRLIDATTGEEIMTRGLFYRDGELMRVTSRGAGTYLLINSERYNCKITADVYGYERKTFEVDYDKLPENRPFLDVYMIPALQALSNVTYYTVEGTLPGIEEIMAVQPGSSYLSYQGFETRRQLLTVFNLHGLAVSEKHYAIVCGDLQSFEIITVKEFRSSKIWALEGPIAGKFQTNDAVERIIYGDVSDDGHYLLRLRGINSPVPPIIAVRVGGELKFQTMEFDSTEPVSLGEERSEEA